MVAWNQIADLEEGDLTDFDATSGIGLSAQNAAAKNGSWGFETDITDTTVRYGELSGPTSETELTVEFWLDPNTLTMGAGENFVIFQDSSVNFAATFRKPASIYQIRIQSKNDGGGFDFAGYDDLKDDWNLIRILWKAATAPAANDGLIQLFIDDYLLAENLGLDNDTKVIEETRFGGVNLIDAGTSGKFYMDDIRWFAGLARPDDLVKFRRRITA